MTFEESSVERIPVGLPNGAVVQFEVTQTGREDVAFDIKPLSQVTDALEGIIQAVAGPIQKAKPTKASVKFGMELGVESGSLTATIVKGTSKANLEITLEWSS
ncbi:MAG: CU044_2847 family protein (plasmid) [Leptolyngbya sp. BL-A-14]